MSILHETRMAVRYAETDQMGVVHHSVFPVYFEVGRTEFFSRYLIPYAEMEARGLLAPVLELSCRFHAGARYGDELVLHTTPDWLRGLRLSMSYRMFRNHPGGELICTGSTCHALLGKGMRPLRRSEFQEIYDRVREVFPNGAG
ncbi:MAG: thioesterase family protein [Candidatus Eremiobacterota bacterium]